MSVRVQDRNLSKAEFVYNAQQLVFILTDRLEKYQNKINKNKRYKELAKSTFYSLWNSPLYHANLVYDYCSLASISDNYNERLQHLSNASKNLKLVERSIETLYNKNRSVIKDKFIIVITEKIDKQKALIKGASQYFRNISCKS